MEARHEGGLYSTAAGLVHAYQNVLLEGVVHLVAILDVDASGHGIPQDVVRHLQRE